MRALELLPYKGLNNGQDPLLIDDYESPRCLNVRFYQKSVKKRDGLLLHIAGQAKNDEVTGVFQLKTGAGVLSQICCCGDDAYRENAAAWTSVKGAVTLTSNATYLFCADTLNDVLILSNGYDQILKWTGATANLAALGGSPPSRCGRLIVYKNFLVLLDTTESAVRYPGRVRWSELNNPESWPAANYNPFQHLTGQTGVGFGKIGDQLYVFFDKSISQMAYTGDSVVPFVFPMVVPDMGAVSGGSIVSVDSACFFLNEKGPYFFDGGSRPQYIGYPIEGTWRTVNTSRLQYAIGTHNPLYNEVWWSFSTGSGTTYDTTIVYNYVNQTWSIFQWGITATCYGSFPYSLPTTPIIGSSNGYVFRGNYSTATDGGTAIDGYVDTKPSGLGNPRETKRIREIQLAVSAESSADNQLVVMTGYDLAQPASIKTVSLSSSGAEWNSAIWGVDLWASVGRMIKRIRPYGRGKLFQMTLRNAVDSQSFNVSSIIVDVDGEVKSEA